jgi:5S rRNA maturation endonuclease (ribonuclease M5)
MLLNTMSLSAQLDELDSISKDHLDEILDKLGVSVKSGKKCYKGSCPIHDGDNLGAFTLYNTNANIPGVWMCHTHLCHEKYGKTLVGLIRGVLSRQQRKTVSRTEAANWLAKFLGFKSIKLIPIPSAAILKKRAQTRLNNNTTISTSLAPARTYSKAWVRHNLIIPATYFVARGYSPEILTQYDVGYYAKFDRVSVPFYDNNHNQVLGFTTRSPYEECMKCGLYHTGECPVTDQEKLNAVKWHHNHDFAMHQYLYNYWFAKEEIKKTGTVFVVEGPADVWRAVEAGINNAVAIMGVSLSDQQSILLNGCGVMNAVVLLDNDEAGERGKKEIKKLLSRQMNLKFPAFDAHDVGEMTIEELQTLKRRIYD